ncbi:MAG: alpha/beta fold hydrolase [Planctomycetota bacterium]
MNNRSVAHLVRVSAFVLIGTALGGPLEGQQDAAQDTSRRSQRDSELHGRAIALFKAGDYAKCAELCERVVAERPKMNWSWYLLGRSRFELDDFEGALEAFTRLVDMCPWSVYLYEKGRTLQELGREEAARLEFDGAAAGLDSETGYKLFVYADNLEGKAPRSRREVITLLGRIAPAPADEPQPPSPHLYDSETVLDCIVHLEDEIVREIPELPQLCDLMSSSKHRVDIGDCELYGEEEGEGVSLVLVNGGPGATHHYFHPFFSRARQFARVVYYDQRGCGLSDHASGGRYTFDQAVDDLERLRKALGIDRWIVLGHSYGGLLAQCYATRYPRATAGLVLVGASTGLQVAMQPSRESLFMSSEERRRIRKIHADPSLSPEQRVYNAFLNGDWKRQSFYRPSRDAIARLARYEWKHDPSFRGEISETMNVELGGLFADCPIPTLIVEGKWDLTWNTDKPGILLENHPGAELVLFEHSAHNPFADEPERFFQVLGDFVRSLPAMSEEKLSQWEKGLAERHEQAQESVARRIGSAGWGRRASEELAGQYEAAWLEEIADPRVLLRLGFALYDTKRYQDGLDAFERMSRVTRPGSVLAGVALVWQGHMLDLLERREEAKARYQAAVAMNVNAPQRHDQYGLAYAPSRYAATRLESAFERIENRLP